MLEKFQPHNMKYAINCKIRKNMQKRVIVYTLLSDTITKFNNAQYLQDS